MVPFPDEPYVIDVGLRPGERDQLLRVLRGNRRMHDEDQRRGERERYRLEVLHRVVRELRIQRRRDRRRSRAVRARWCSRRPASLPRSRARSCRRSPARLSAITCWPHASVSFCASVREIVSVPPPGGKGTTQRTVWWGTSAPPPSRTAPEMQHTSGPHKHGKLHGPFLGGVG